MERVNNKVQDFQKAARSSAWSEVGVAATPNCFWFGWKKKKKNKDDAFVKRHPRKRPRRSSEGRADRNSSCAFVCVREQQRYSTVFISTAFSPKRR